MFIDMVPHLETIDRLALGDRRIMKRAGIVKYSCTATVGTAVKRKTFRSYFKGRH